MDSLICWVGGKKQLRAVIAEMIPDDINGYIEPFGGAGWVLFYKDRWAKVEVYNDIDSRLTNLFKIAKYHPEEMKREMNLMIDSRLIFEEVLTQPGFTDVQRAARFFYLIKRSFAGQANHFGTSKKDNSAKSLKNMINQIMKVSERLDRVKIENLSYQKVFEIYDTPNNFFFLDPPYRFGHQYKSGRMDYKEFKADLEKLKGRFLLTLDDCPQNRTLFKEYKIKPVKRVNGINRKTIVNNHYKELIITNY